MKKVRSSKQKKEVPAPIDLLENWNDLNVRLNWAYDKKLDKQDGAYTPSPIAAWLLRQGKVTLRLPSGKEHYGPNTWIFPPEVKGWQEFTSDVELLSVRFTAEWPNGNTLFPRPKTLAIPAEKLPKLTRIGERLARLIKERFPDVTLQLNLAPTSPEGFFEMQRLFYGWVSEYVQVMRAQGITPYTIGKLDSRVHRAIQIMDRQRLSEPVREADLAEKVGISIPQLNRLFLRGIGKTPVEYWEKKRIDATWLGITESNKSMKSMAFDLGFGSLPHFSTWVKKKLGKSPRALRKSVERHDK